MIIRMIQMLRSIGIGWSIGFIVFYVFLNKDEKKNYKMNKKKYMIYNIIVVILTIILIVIELMID